VNGVKVDVETPDGTKTLAEEALDPLRMDIWTPGPHPHATIGFTAGRSLGYGEVKLSAHVTLQCDQTDAALERAANRAFEKAVSFLEIGFGMLTK